MIEVVDAAHVHAHLELEIRVVAEHGGRLQPPIGWDLACQFSGGTRERHRAGHRPDDGLTQRVEPRRLDHGRPGAGIAGHRTMALLRLILFCN